MCKCLKCTQKLKKLAENQLRKVLFNCKIRYFIVINAKQLLQFANSFFLLLTSHVLSQKMQQAVFILPQ